MVSDLITWYLDDKPVRMLGRRNKHGLPCSPMFLKFSLWSVEDDDEGTIAWAGGAASFSEGPFTMHIKILKCKIIPRHLPIPMAIYAMVIGWI